MPYSLYQLPEESKLLAQSHDYFLNGLKLKDTTVRCIYLRISKWGVLQKYDPPNRQRVWILYTKFFVERLGNSRLAYAKIKLDFKIKSTASHQESHQGSHGVIVTEYYGPDHIQGPSEKRDVHKKGVFGPKVNVGVGPANASIEVGSREKVTDQEKIERWHFDAMRGTSEDEDGRLVRCIEWTIKEARHTADPTYKPEWKLGVVLLHDNREFEVLTKFSIKFNSWLAGIGKFSSKEPGTATLVRPEDKAEMLDEIACG